MAGMPRPANGYSPDAASSFDKSMAIFQRVLFTVSSVTNSVCGVNLCSSPHLVVDDARLTREQTCRCTGYGLEEGRLAHVCRRHSRGPLDDGSSKRPPLVRAHASPHPAAARVTPAPTIIDFYVPRRSRVNGYRRRGDGR